MLYQIGVDVGGTNTDAVLCDRSALDDVEKCIRATYKAPTTPDVTTGILEAAAAVLKGVDPSKVRSLTIGTTAFVNSVLARDAANLDKVAVIRISGPYCKANQPLCDWPPSLASLVRGHTAWISGGQQINGRPIQPLNEAEVIAQCEIIREKGLKVVVLVAVFSPLDNDGQFEKAAASIIQREIPGILTVCSRDIGQIGFLGRENSSILNGAILRYASRTIKAFQKAARELKLSCPLFLTTNDGCLTTADQAMLYPIRTFSSGPSNSMRGAAFLAGIGGAASTKNDAPVIVCDVGGTTSDVGVLLPSGFPRQAASVVEVGGVRTAFPMPDVQSIALGGGTIIRESSGKVTVGPDSVGHALTTKAKCFGGDIATTSDLLVSTGQLDIGDSKLVKDIFPEPAVKAAQLAIKTMFENIVDRMKTSEDDVTLLICGGGSVLCPEKLAGVAQILRPPHFGVANAVGAAMAKVAGEIDTLVDTTNQTMASFIEKLSEEAKMQAIRGGAEASTVQVVEVTVLPVQYVKEPMARVIIKAVGELSPQFTASFTSNEVHDDDSGYESSESKDFSTVRPEVDPEPVDAGTYRPHINSSREWIVSKTDLDFIADGAYVLGVGGGGDPYPGVLACRQMLDEGKSIRIVDHCDVPKEATFVRCGFMGSPSTSGERMEGGNEILHAYERLMEHLKIEGAWGTISDEIGGGNGLQQLLLGARLGIPALDADLMGRAYPHLYQTLPIAYGVKNSAWPVSIANGEGDCLVYTQARNAETVEHVLRVICAEYGSSAGIVGPPLLRDNCINYGVPRSVSMAWRLGREIALCRKRNDLRNIGRALLSVQNGACLFIGKIVGVDSEVRSGFTFGRVLLAPLLSEELEAGDDTSLMQGIDPEDRLVIPYQNENLSASLIKAKTGQTEILAVVPDLISVLDSQNGQNLGTPDYRYGLRVTVMAFAVHPSWTTDEGIKNGGPQQFGLDTTWQQRYQYKEPRSVIEEFA